jgi:enoyl-[acyl-carrier protein] reductase/trans-2-enoyl-CoA reductase (NAD+)
LRQKRPRTDRLRSQAGGASGKSQARRRAGCSTGYGLASRIVSTFAGGADTIGVSLEREPTATRTGSAGWYNNRAFEIEAKKIGRSPLTLEGDAFSDEMKDNFIARA